MIEVRLLGPGDGQLLATVLAAGDQFELDPADPPEPDAIPLDIDGCDRLLADPAVRHWVATSLEGPGVAVDGVHVVGELFCVIHPVRQEPGREVLLYEIATHHERRRQGIGRALLTELDHWCATEGLTSIWVLADNVDAAAFYRSCGYGADENQPTYLERRPQQR